eukprot:7964-Heterococcus_DN1.PRE.1
MTAMVIVLSAAMIIIYMMIRCCRAFCSLLTKLIVVSNTDIGLVDASALDGIDAHKLLHVLYVLHEQKWIGRPSVSRLQYSVDSTIAADDTLSDDGVDAGLMANAVDIAAAEGWIEPASCVLEHWNNEVNVHFTVSLSEDTVQALLAHTAIGHLTLNMLGQSEVKVFGMMMCKMAKCTRLRTVQSFELQNLDCSHAAELLAIMDIHCPSVHTITLSQEGTDEQQQEVLDVNQGVNSNNSKVLHIIGGGFGGLVVPATVKTLKMVNSNTLPTLNEGLTLLDLKHSRLAQSFGLDAIPRSVKHLILPDRYAHAIGVLPPGLKYLDIVLTFNQELGTLPDTLEELVMMRDDDEQPYRPIPSHLPAALRVLRVDNVLCITQAASDEYPTVLQLPPQLEVLHVKHLQGRLYMLPASLKVPYVDGMTYNEPLGLLPPTLEELDLSHADSFQQPLGVLPSTLQIIRLNSEYTQALQSVPPGATVQYVRTTAAPADTEEHADY